MLTSKFVIRLVEAQQQIMLLPLSNGQHISRRFLTPMSAYEQKIQSKQLLPDKDQKNTTQELENLFNTLKTYTPKPVRVDKSGGGFFGRFMKKDQGPPKIELMNTNAPKGMYIYGSVGGGKTTLMDMFYDCCVDVGENT